MPTVPNIDALEQDIRSGKRPGKILSPRPRAQHQEGPNCGFYALSIVLAYWREAGKDVDVAYARKRDRPLDTPPPAGPSLRRVGKEVGALTQHAGGSTQPSTGGVFTVSQLAAVAKAQRNCEVQVAACDSPRGFINRLCEIIDEGVPPIVAFDVDGATGDPIEASGQNSHWGVLIGHCNTPIGQFFVATHGHGKYYLWQADKLQRSNFGLANTVRVVKREQKTRQVRTSAGDPHLRKAAQNWNWSSVEDIAEAKRAAGQPHSIVISVEERPDAIRPEIRVPHDLAHRILLVKPMQASA